MGTPAGVELTYTGLTTPDPVLMQRELRASLVEQGFEGLRHRGLVHRHRRAPPGRHPHRAWPCSPTSRRTTWTTTARWTPTGRPRPSCSAGPACAPRWSTSTTPTAPACARTCAAGIGALDVWTVSCEQAGAPAGADIGYDDAGLRFTGGRRRRAPRWSGCDRLIGQYNVSNLLGVLGMMRALGVPLARPSPPAPTCCRCRAAWSAQRAGRQAAGRGRLRPHARRARQGPAGLRPLARQRGGRCGACSAAAATATRPSAR
jgi:UDP-N-acetylmuramoyl-L-alanyl-D-glutamate--2,6-diaminopimelate ligase